MQATISYEMQANVVQGGVSELFPPLVMKCASVYELRSVSFCRNRQNESNLNKVRKERTKELWNDVTGRLLCQALDLCTALVCTLQAAFEADGRIKPEREKCL